MTTFSQLVDNAIQETKRPDMVLEISRYLNQVVRELHADPERGAVILFSDNYRESQQAITDTTRMVWDIPNPQLWQVELCVRLDGTTDGNGKPVYATRTTPGPHISGLSHFYYRAQNQIAVGANTYYGLGNIGSMISFAYYEFPRAHRYYDVTNRPAQFDDDYGWLYGAKYMTQESELDDEGLRALARELCTNWILQRWQPVVEEGLRAKIYKRLGDQTRAALSYSLYMQARKAMFTSEVQDTTAVYTTR